MKKALLVLAVLLLLIGGGVWWALSSLDFLVKSALEHYGPQVLGVSVKVGQVEISSRDGRGLVRGLDIGSPAGYSSPRTVRVGSATLAVDAATLTSPVVTIREISVDAPEITYELAGGKANLDVIQRNIETYLKRADSEPTNQQGSGKPPSERKYIIHAANIRKARVTVTNPLLKGGGLSFTLPDIELRDLGKRSNGITGGEVAKIVTATLASRIATRALTSGQLLERGTEGLKDGAKDLLREFFKTQ